MTTITEWYVSEQSAPQHGAAMYNRAPEAQAVAHITQWTRPHTAPSATVDRPVPRPAGPTQAASCQHRQPGLGSATAGPSWGWTVPVPTPQPMPYALPTPTALARTELAMPPTVLRAMAAAAATAGRSQSEIWAEAACEWLRRHAQDDDPPPPPPGAAAPHPGALHAARERCWSAIDVLLGDLRSARPQRLDPAA